MDIKTLLYTIIFQDQVFSQSFSYYLHCLASQKEDRILWIQILL